MNDCLSIMTRHALKSLSIGILLLIIAPVAAATDVLVVALFKDKAMVEIDGKRHLLRAGETSPEGVTLVAANSAEAVLEIDGKRSAYPLGSRVSTRFSAPGPRAEVRIWSDQRGMFTTVGAINGMPVQFLIDTGATTVAMNASEAKRLGINYRFKGRPGAVSTASGVARAYQVKLDRVQVGAIKLFNVDAVVLDGDSPRRPLLGMSFLGRVNMQNDGAVMVLRQKF